MGDGISDEDTIRRSREIGLTSDEMREYIAMRPEVVEYNSGCEQQYSNYKTICKSRVCAEGWRDMNDGDLLSAWSIIDGNVKSMETCRSERLKYSYMCYGSVDVSHWNYLRILNRELTPCLTIRSEMMNDQRVKNLVRRDEIRREQERRTKEEELMSSKMERIRSVQRELPERSTSSKSPSPAKKSPTAAKKSPTAAKKKKSPILSKKKKMEEDELLSRAIEENKKSAAQSAPQSSPQSAPSIIDLSEEVPSINRHQGSLALMANWLAKMYITRSCSRLCALVIEWINSSNTQLYLRDMTIPISIITDRATRNYRPLVGARRSSTSYYDRLYLQEPEWNINMLDLLASITPTALIAILSIDISWYVPDDVVDQEQFTVKSNAIAYAIEVVEANNGNTDILDDMLSRRTFITGYGNEMKKLLAIFKDSTTFRNASPDDLWSRRRDTKIAGISSMLALWIADILSEEISNPTIDKTNIFARSTDEALYGIDDYDFISSIFKMNRDEYLRGKMIAVTTYSNNNILRDAANLLRIKNILQSIK